MKPEKTNKVNYDSISLCSIISTIFDQFPSVYCAYKCLRRILALAIALSSFVPHRSIFSSYSFRFRIAALHGAYLNRFSTQSAFTNARAAEYEDHFEFLFASCGHTEMFDYVPLPREVKLCQQRRVLFRRLVNICCTRCFYL